MAVGDKQSGLRKRKGLAEMKSAHIAAFACAIVVVAGCAKTEVGKGVANITPGAPKSTTTVKPDIATPAPPALVDASGKPLKASDAAPNKKPNLVVIMTDDQTMESMRVLAQTKQLIVDQGMSFPNSVSVYPTCCPARASFFTGQYPHNHGVLFNSGPTGGYDNFRHQDTTMQVALQKAGYRTAHIGKYLNNYGMTKPKEVPPGWDNWNGLVGLSTGQYLDYTINENGKLVTAPKGKYQTDDLTERAVKEIASASTSDKPFFLSLAYLAPHASFGCPLADCTAEQISQDITNANEGTNLETPVPSKEDAGKFASEPLPANPAFYKSGTNQPISEFQPKLTPEIDGYITRNYRAELESLLSVDRGVTQVMTALENAGVLDNTYIAFTSDNGYFHGEHSFEFGKYFPYEESLKVPLIIRGPGIAPASANSTVVSNVDLTATLLDLADAAPLRLIDGSSLWPLLTATNARWNRPVMIEGLSPPIALQPQYYGFRTERFVFFQYSGGGYSHAEMYDLVADPFQMKNLAADPNYRDQVLKYAKLAFDARHCRGSECTGLTLPTTDVRVADQPA